jgi:hypothetical protein
MSSVSCETPMEFFRDALGEAMANERLTVEPFTEYYLVQLLADVVEGSWHPTETLGDVYVRAQAMKPVDRRRTLRSIGDRALVFSGLWWEHNFRPLRPSHAKYHVELGRLAYREIGGVPFDEIAQKFDGIVDALVRLGTDASLRTARDLLRLYLIWQETGSGYAARVLVRNGLVPSASKSGTPS